MTTLSRRRFMGVTAGAVGTVLAGSRISIGQEVPSSFDVVIVGGGISGLFCAMRLQAAGVNVGLFEASDRLGGRALSVLLPGFSEEAAEVGGMRLRTTDAVEIKLIDTLIGADAKVDFAYPTHAWFLRDRLLRELNDPAKIPYGLDPAEQEIVRSGKNLLVETIQQMAASGTAGSPEAIDQGIWEQVLKIRSEEGLNFIVDSTGYNSLTFNWNVRAALPWFEEDFAPDTKYFKVRGGLQRIPDEIAAAYVKDGGKIYTEHPLRLAERNDDGSMVLTFETLDGARQVTAGKVILGLPPAAMEQLDPSSFFLADDRFRAAINGVIRVHLGKIHLAFERPWWEETGYGTGRTITDIPMRQSYLWGKDAESGRCLAMASYHDGPSIEFWRELATGDAYGPKNWIDEAIGPDGKPLPPSLVNSLPASRLMVEEVWRQMKQAHDMPDNAPAPILGTYRNWGEDPLYGAGVHLWSIGTNSRQTMDYMREPFPGLYVCGEAWSLDQGWVKGATSTAETVLQQKFGLPPYLSE